MRELGDERAVVTLGEAPEAGDTAEEQPLPAYRELARVLEPWLYHEPYIKDEFTPEEMLRWERRFLD
ncbi:type VI immunity family protein [Cystobacter fuscus]